MSKILSPIDLERCCRLSIKFHPKRGALAIRVALAASILHGDNWFPAREVQNSLSGAGFNGSNVGEIASRLVTFGVAERKLVSFPSYNRHDVRLTCSLVDLDHFHGERSMRLRDDFEIYYGLKPQASPLAALLLLGIHLYGIQQSNELGKFLLPEFDIHTKQALPSRTLNQCCDIGLLTIARQNPANLARPYLVIPVQRVQYV